FAYRLATAGADIRRKSLAILLMPAVLKLAPSEPFGFRVGIAAIIFADRRAFLELPAPPFQNFRSFRSNRAVELQVIPRNPTAILRRRLPKLERREMRTLSPEQSRTVLGELRGTPHYWPVLLALSTGGRRGEILALRWRNFDLDRSIVRITESISPKLVIGPTKSGKRRVVTLPAGTVQELRRWRREQAEQLLRLGVRQDGDTMVCTWPDGSTVTPESTGHFCKRLFKRLGLPVHFHSLRHTHATQLLIAGVHPKVVQERLGHATVAMTLDVYSHVTEKLHDDAAAKID